jgi:putative ABC transport system permease protein
MSDVIPSSLAVIPGEAGNDDGYLKQFPPGCDARRPVLELRAVTKTYGAEPPVAALRGVSFSVYQGEFVAIVGPSGSGKSTLLHLMGTLDRPSSGVVAITGLDVARLSDGELAALRATRVGFVFQQFFLAEHATVLENVADGLLYAGVEVRERRRAAAEALSRVGLEDKIGARPTQLSGGQRQRVAIARALVGRPAIVLADEPTGNLDSAAGAAILGLLEELHAEGATIVVITHDQDLAARVPREIRVRDGHIVADTTRMTAHAAATPARAGDECAYMTAEPRSDAPVHAPMPGVAAAIPAPPDALPALTPATLRPADLARVAGVGVRTRRLRAALSALGIAIGVAAIVAVLGLSASSQAGLLAEIDRLGTNLLTVTNGQNLLGQAAELPKAAPAMVARIGPVTQVADTGSTGVSVYRSPLIPRVETNALSVQAGSLDLLPAIGTGVAQGRYLNAATATEPVAVLGAVAAQRLGIDHVYPGERVWLGGQWFYVVGILQPAVLAPEIDSSVLIGFPAARTYLDFDGHPSTIYVRARTDQVEAVQGVLAATANPEAPNEVDVSQPSAALVARAAAQSALNGLFLGLGAVSLLVGAVGVANIMVISVLERRSEIGLRRALGATRGHIRAQFLSEAVLLAGLGGVAGVAIGALSTAVYALTRGWSITVPALAWGGGFGAALAIGALAGLLPALRAARLSPTDALRTV